MDAKHLERRYGKMAETDLISRQAEQDIEHCATCVHDEDSVEICVLRNCKYAIAELIDCYEPKQPEQRWIPCDKGEPEGDKK